MISDRQVHGTSDPVTLSNALVTLCITGKVSLSQLREGLALSHLSLTAIQVQKLCAEARQDESGNVSYGPFSRAAAMLVSGMLDEVPKMITVPLTPTPTAL